MLYNISDVIYFIFIVTPINSTKLMYGFQGGNLSIISSIKPKNIFYLIHSTYLLISEQFKTMSTLTEAKCGICSAIIQHENALTHLYNCCEKSLNNDTINENAAKYYCFLYILNYIEEYDNNIQSTHPFIVGYVYSLYEIIYFVRLNKGDLNIGLQVDNLSRIALSNIPNFIDHYINIFPGFDKDNFGNIAFNFQYDVLFTRPQIHKLWHRSTEEIDSK